MAERHAKALPREPLNERKSLVKLWCQCDDANVGTMPVDDVEKAEPPPPPPERGACGFEISTVIRRPSSSRPLSCEIAF